MECIWTVDSNEQRLPGMAPQDQQTAQKRKPTVLSIEHIVVYMQGGQSSTNPSEMVSEKVTLVSTQEIQSHPGEIVQSMERL